MRYILLQVSTFVSHPNSYRLQSILGVNFFLFPSERRNIFSSWYPQDWYQNNLPNDQTISTLGEVFGNDKNLNDFIHSFLQSCIHLFPSENKPVLCEWKE